MATAVCPFPSADARQGDIDGGRAVRQHVEVLAELLPSRRAGVAPNREETSAVMATQASLRDVGRRIIGTFSGVARRAQE